MNILRILFVEDLPSDVELEVLELRKEKIVFDYISVCTRADLEKALVDFKPDLIISDYMMPSFNGMQALKISKQISPDIPFIICTGSVNEEIAVSCIKEGAEDYVIKEHLTRLPFAVKEALSQFEIRKAKKASDLLLKESHRSLNTLISNLHGIVYRCKNDDRWTMEFLSEGTSELTGYSPGELIQNSTISYNDLIHKDDREHVWADVQEGLKSKKHFQSTYRIVTKSGEIRWVWEKGDGFFSEEGELEFLEGFITDITDRKNIEESLKLSEEKFRSIAENLSDIIFITDKEGIVKYVSPSSILLGYNQDDIIGEFFGDFLAEGELETGMEYFRNALSSVTNSNVVSLVFRRKDGTKFFAELSGSVFEITKDENGVLGLIRDVSDKVSREEELRKLSRAVEQNPVSIVITNTEGIMEYVNRRMCEVTGYEKSELIGRNPSVLSTHEKTKEEYKTLWDTIMSGADWKGEFHNKKKTGELYWERATISPIKNEKNEITHFLGIKEDITMRKLLEKATLESEKRYRELFLNNPIPAYIFDEKTLAFVEVNDATVEYYGYTREEFSKMTLKDLRIEEDIPYLLDSIEELNDKVFHSVAMRHRRKNGEVFPVELTSHALEEKNGRRTRLVMASDITEQVKAAEHMKLAKEKAEASDRLKTLFLNNISHEVRTPLNGILGFAEIMNQPDLSEEDRIESISMLHESSERLLDTITNYMDISLITSGNLSLNKREFSPGVTLQDLYNDFKPLSLSRNLKLFLDIQDSDDGVVLNSDNEILRKIIRHLMSNAIKFTETGYVKFGYKISQGEIEFFVEDSGIGIAKESLGIIFDRFVKEDRDPFKVSEGSGLGLSIVKGMAAILGGDIRVVSEPGKGTSVYFTLPLSNESVIIVSDPQDKMSAEPSGIMKILVAEDDETNFFYLRAILSREGGITILRASNGQEAVDLYKLNPDISIILMDIKMPVMDGIEATRQIKLLNKNIPVIAITAFAMAGDEERVLAAGCDAYLSKPISKKNLLDKIAFYVK